MKYWYNELGGEQMAKMKSFEERYEDDILSDNTHADYCRQCKECTLWGLVKDDPMTNRYDKASCAMFPYPDHKPGYVINNQGVCPYRTAR